MESGLDPSGLEEFSIKGWWASFSSSLGNACGVWRSRGHGGNAWKPWGLESKQ